MPVTISVPGESVQKQIVCEITADQFAAAARDVLKNVTEKDKPEIVVSRVDRRGCGWPVNHTISTLDGWLTGFSLNRDAWADTLRITTTISKPSSLANGREVTTITVNRSTHGGRRTLVRQTYTNVMPGNQGLSLK